MASLAHALRRKLPPHVVFDDPETLAIHAKDRWFASRTPDAVVMAESPEDVLATVAEARRLGVAVTARGGGVGYVGGCVPSAGGIALSLARMNRIREISRPDGVAVVEAGVITGDLQAAARKKKLFYPPDPASLKNSTIGGNIATNAGGPRCLKYGVTRHYVLGLDVALADGSLLRCGGRTHKNKAGFDLVGLFTGSEGLLGIVTAATLRLLPLPPARAAVSAGFSTFRASARAVQRVLGAGFLPSSLEIADAFTLDAARRYLGADFLPGAKAQLIAEVDGQPASVRAELKSLVALLRRLGATGIRTASGDRECGELWRMRRVYSQSLRATGLTKLNEDVVVPRGNLVDLVAFAEAEHRRHGFPVACFGHAGDGNIHVNIMVPGYATDPAARAKADDALDRLFERVVALGGTISGEHGIGLAKARWWPLVASETNRRVHAALKAALDPHGTLNPGKFVAIPDREGSRTH